MQFLEFGGGAGADDFRDLGGQILADAGETGKVLILGHHGAQFRAEIAHGARGVVIGANAEGIAALDFQKFGDLLEAGGDVGVVDGHGPRFPVPMGLHAIYHAYRLEDIRCGNAPCTI